MRKAMMLTLLLCALSAQAQGLEEFPPVTFKGTQPGISDFVTAILSQDNFGAQLRDMATNWNERQKGKPLTSNATFIVDERNGYVRYDVKPSGRLSEFSPAEHAWTEFCFWNCADGKHKLVARYCGYLMGGRPVDTENTGLVFYRYNTETHRLTYAFLNELGINLNLPENDQCISYALPRTGKDIVASIYDEAGKRQCTFRWNGNNFDQQ